MTRLLLMKTLSDELQGIDDPRAPISPGMRPVPHPELMRYPLIHERNMQEAIAFAETVVITAIDPVSHLPKLLSGLIPHDL